MNINSLIFSFLLIFTVIQASAQQKTNIEKADSIAALLPQKQGDERLKALETLAGLTHGTEKKQYLYMQLDEARRQKNILSEGTALMILTLEYHTPFDTDSIFIIGEEAVRFNRQHRLYGNMFFARSAIIRRHKVQGRVFTALRQAEEAYAETKELGEPAHTARMLSTMADILLTMQQYGEAAGYFLESIELMKPYRHERPFEFFILDRYNFLSLAYKHMNRPHEMLNFTDSMQVEMECLKRKLPDYNFEHYHYYVENNRALAYAMLKQPDRALEAIRRAEAVFDPAWIEANPAFAAEADNMYAAYYHATGDYDRALERYRRIVRFEEEAGLEAISFKKNMARILAEKGDYRAANELHSEILQRREELNTERFHQQINELRTIYKLDRAEQEIVREKEKRQQMQLRLLILSVSLTIICGLLGVVTVLYRRKRAAYRELVRKSQEWALTAVEYAGIVPRAAGTGAAPIDDKCTEIIIHDKETEHVTGEDDRQLFQKMQQLFQDERLYRESTLSIEEVARRMKVNRTYLSRAINRCYGKNFNACINEYRIREAVLLMSATAKKYSLEGIAYEVGFNDRRIFYNAFKKQTGLSPSEFQKNLEKK